jgi:hypothetical protein
MAAMLHVYSEVANFRLGSSRLTAASAYRGSFYEDHVLGGAS